VTNVRAIVQQNKISERSLNVLDLPHRCQNWNIVAMLVVVDNIVSNILEKPKDDEDLISLRELETIVVSYDESSTSESYNPPKRLEHKQCELEFCVRLLSILP
jgi:hypothetical protein